MLAKRYRLPVEEVFRRRGRSVRSPFFILKVFPALTPHNRYGVAVGKNLSKSAVSRNRLKRAIFNFIRMDKLTVPHNDYLVIPAPAVCGLSTIELSKELKHIFSLITNY